MALGIKYIKIFLMGLRFYIPVAVLQPSIIAPCGISAVAFVGREVASQTPSVPSFLMELCCMPALDVRGWVKAP